jgi:hypothetical protein
MLEVSFVGYLVTGAFLSVPYIDLFYQIIAAVIMLEVAAAKEAGKTLPVPVEATPERRNGHRMPTALPVRGATNGTLVHVRDRRTR